MISQIIVIVITNIDKIVISQVADKDLPQYQDFMKETLHHKGSTDQGKYHLVEEGEKDAWRSICFENKNEGFGHIAYNNPTDAYLNERITFNNLFGVNLIPFLETSKLEDHEFDEIEDAFEREVAQVMRKRQESSNFSIISVPDAKKGISVQNPLVVQVTIAPHSRGVLALEKYESDAAIDIESNIVLTYPLSNLLTEKKTQVKKNRIKYNNKFVEIFEVVCEHNKGILFKYRNKTKDLKLTAHLKFTDLHNLAITTRSDELVLAERTEEEIKENPEHPVKIADLDFDIQDKSMEIVICVEPNQTKFFELTSIDIYGEYSYDVEMDYHINLSRSHL